MSSNKKSNSKRYVRSSICDFKFAAAINRIVRISWEGSTVLENDQSCLERSWTLALHASEPDTIIMLLYGVYVSIFSNTSIPEQPRHVQV